MEQVAEIAGVAGDEEVPLVAVKPEVVAELRDQRPGRDHDERAEHQRGRRACTGRVRGSGSTATEIVEGGGYSGNGARDQEVRDLRRPPACSAKRLPIRQPASSVSTRTLVETCMLAHERGTVETGAQPLPAPTWPHRSRWRHGRDERSLALGERR